MASTKRLLVEQIDIDVRDECRDERSATSQVLGDIFHFQSSFDEEPSCDIGSDLSKGGWAKRNGFSVRVMTVDATLTSAISIAIVRLLLSPLSIWSEKFLPTNNATRDVFIELGRAYPPLDCETKCKVGAQIIRTAIRELRAEFKMHGCKKKKQASAFLCALRSSKNNLFWKTEDCKFCCAKRTDMSLPILILPCEHVLCASTRCWNSSVFEKCPLCSIEELRDPDRKSIRCFDFCGAQQADESALWTVVIDDSLPIPLEFIERCKKNVS